MERHPLGVLHGCLVWDDFGLHFVSQDIRNHVVVQDIIYLHVFQFATDTTGIYTLRIDT